MNVASLIWQPRVLFNSLAQIKARARSLNRHFTKQLNIRVLVEEKSKELRANFAYLPEDFQARSRYVSLLSQF